MNRREFITASSTALAATTISGCISIGASEDEDGRGSGAGHDLAEFKTDTGASIQASIAVVVPELYGTVGYDWSDGRSVTGDTSEIDTDQFEKVRDDTTTLVSIWVNDEGDGLPPSDAWRLRTYESEGAGGVSGDYYPVEDEYTHYYGETGEFSSEIPWESYYQEGERRGFLRYDIEPPSEDVMLFYEPEERGEWEMRFWFEDL